jgi:hypothetical protein
LADRGDVVSVWRRGVAYREDSISPPDRSRIRILPWALGTRRLSKRNDGSPLRMIAKRSDAMTRQRTLIRRAAQAACLSASRITLFAHEPLETEDDARVSYGNSAMVIRPLRRTPLRLPDEKFDLRLAEVKTGCRTGCCPSASGIKEPSPMALYIVRRTPGE